MMQNDPHFDYLKWFFIFAWAPTMLIWAFYWRVLVKYIRVFFYCIAGSILFGVPWDYWATHSWVWHFSPNHTLGTQFLGLPLEEYVFFISETILYASLVLVLRKKFAAKTT